MGTTRYGYVCNIGRKLNLEVAVIGDTFTLKMPYVFTMLRIDNYQYVTTSL
jgi:hypothetical protein